MKVPACVRFNRTVWNSEPFQEDFLYDLRARKYYALESSDCRSSLINLFCVLDFWTMQTESQSSVRKIISSLCVILAVNVRDSEIVPLTQSFHEDEFACDPSMAEGLEKPISKWNQVSEEIRNAVRSVERFDIVAPALAWAIVRFFIGGIAIAETVDAELDRWKRNGSLVPYPRGCVAFLERKLPLVKNFNFLPYDLATVVKATAVYLRSNAAQLGNSTSTSLTKQLARFTRCFIDRSLGPWTPLEMIAAGSIKIQAALIESFQGDCESPELAQAIANLSVFFENIAKRFNGFKLDGHYVYSVYKSRMMTYMSDSQNSELTAEIYKVHDILADMQDVENIHFDANDGDPAVADGSARRRAKIFLMALTPEERLLCLERLENSRSVVPSSDSMDLACGKTGKRRKRRKKKNQD